jgi:hypothetical protein
MAKLQAHPKRFRIHYDFNHINKISRTGVVSKPGLFIHNGIAALQNSERPAYLYDHICTPK